MTRKRLIFLTGISGSGKTTTMNKFKKIDPYDTDIITSSTRGYYGTTKYSNEKSVQLSNRANIINHQLNMMDYISDTLSKKINNSRKDHIVIDRSYIDYAVYSYMEGAFSKDELIRLSKQFHYTYLTMGFNISNILYLKRLNNVNTDDGFRENRSVDYYIEYANLIKECAIQDYGEYNLYIDVTDSLNDVSTPEKLANDVLWEIAYNKVYNLFL